MHFFNEHVWILIKFSLKFVPKGSINNIPALVQIMVWHRPSDKPLSEAMMVNLPTHICVSRPQWVNKLALTIADVSQDCSSKWVTSEGHQIRFEATYIWWNFICEFISGSRISCSKETEHYVAMQSNEMAIWYLYWKQKGIFWIW